MLLKAGVDISRLERNTRRALGRCDTIFREYGDEMVVTSTYEGTHSAGSLHYGDMAFDLRKTEHANEIVFRLIKELGKDFDIVWRDKNHIHVEYDPK